MKDFKVNQLTKVLVMSVIKDSWNPCLEAADQVRRVLMIALKDVVPADREWSEIVEDACQGGIVALLLSKKDIAMGAVEILRATTQVASELNLDGVRMREGTLQGIADVQRFATPNDILRVRAEIIRHFPAADKEFAYALRKAVFYSLQPTFTEYWYMF